MNRRSFLQRFTTSVVATAALVSLPASLVKAAPALVEPARLWACERLRKAYNEWSAIHRTHPEALIVGRDLYEMYEGELMLRWRFMATDAPYQHLLFKGAKVIPRGRGYGIEIHEVLEYRANRTGAA